METLLQDIRYGVRMLLKAPSFSIVATIALALGIGANTAIFSVVNAVLLRPLPFANSERLMSVFETNPARGQLRGAASYPNFVDWRAQNTVFERLSSYHNNDFIMTGGSEAARLRGAVVNADLFPLLGATPMLGRTFLPDEDKPNGDRAVILSQQLFQKYFNSDPSIINKSIVLDGKSYIVVGVMPQAFEFPLQNEPAELWTTVSGDASGEDPITTQRGAHYMNVIGLLKPGVSQPQAQAEMSTIAARLEQQYPDANLHRGITVESSLQALVGDIRPALLILLGAVGCVLLIACANVANLLLARAMTRHKEMAIRSALGASRMRVIRQLLTESILLSLAGGAIGLLLAIWWSDLLIALGKKDIPRAMHVGLDWRVLGFTLVVSVVTGIIFGLVPALQSSKTRLTETLKESRGSGEGARRNRVRGVLVVAELSVAVVLLVGAGLLIQSLWRLRQVSPGFESSNVLTFSVALPEVKYSSEKQIQFFDDLGTRLQSLPGVQSSSPVMPLPLGGNRFSISFETEGRPVAKGDEPTADFFSIGGDYFRAMGIPVLKGRVFDAHDQHKSTPVIIVSEAFARQYFPNEEVLGKRIEPGISTHDDDEDSVMREIVGVVGDVKHRSLGAAARPSMYVPYGQIPISQMTVVVKANGDPHSIAAAVTREVNAKDKDLPVFSVKTLDEYLAASVSAPRFNTTLLGIFASVALVLTIVGLYGVMSYSVAQRTGEIGIRIALGAQTSDVLRLVVGQGLRLVLIGLGVGLVGAFALTRVMTSLLFGVDSKDPWTFTAVALLLTLVALLACYIPARRATRVDPMVALRYE